LQLYCYDLKKRHEEIEKQQCHSHAMKIVEDFYIIEQDGKPQKHIIFNKVLGPLEDAVDDATFLAKQYILI